MRYSVITKHCIFAYIKTHLKTVHWLTGGSSTSAAKKIICVNKSYVTVLLHTLYICVVQTHSKTVQWLTDRSLPSWERRRLPQRPWWPTAAPDTSVAPAWRCAPSTAARSAGKWGRAGAWRACQTAWSCQKAAEKTEGSKGPRKLPRFTSLFVFFWRAHSLFNFRAATISQREKIHWREHLTVDASCCRGELLNEQNPATTCAFLIRGSESSSMHWCLNAHWELRYWIGYPGWEGGREGTDKSVCGDGDCRGYGRL